MWTKIEKKKNLTRMKQKMPTEDGRFRFNLDIFFLCLCTCGIFRCWWHDHADARRVLAVGTPGAVLAHHLCNDIHLSSRFTPPRWHLRAQGHLRTTCMQLHMKHLIFFFLHLFIYLCQLCSDTRYRGSVIVHCVIWKFLKGHISIIIFLAHQSPDITPAKILLCLFQIQRKLLRHNQPVWIFKPF